MSRQYNYYAYIMTNRWRTVFYVGVTTDLYKRTWQHVNKIFAGFTKKYNVNKLVYYEHFDNIGVAIKREKQLKKYSRRKKVTMINKFNPEWEDFFTKFKAFNYGISRPVK